MKKIFVLSSSNNPSGGTKVLNQFVNLFIAKGYQSFLVITGAEAKKAKSGKREVPRHVLYVGLVGAVSQLSPGISSTLPVVFLASSARCASPAWANG